MYSLLLYFGTINHALIQAQETGPSIAELDQKVQQLVAQTYGSFEECRARYHDLCKGVLERLLNDLHEKGIQPDPVPRFFELKGPLTESSSYEIKVTYSLETPHIIAQTRFDIQKSKEQYVTWVLTPLIEITLPLQQPSPDLVHPYFDPDMLHAILAHELGHIWRFDVIKLQKFVLCSIPLIITASIGGNIMLGRYFSSNHQDTFLLKQLKLELAAQLFSLGLVTTWFKILGLAVRQKEYAADTFSREVASTIPSYKQAIAVMARFHILEALELTVIDTYYNWRIQRWLAKFKRAQRPHTHPHSLERVAFFLEAWRKLRAEELQEQGINLEEASGQAAQEVSAEYTELISSMYVFDTSKFDEICEKTYKWKPDTEEKRTRLLNTMEQAKQQLLHISGIEQNNACAH